MDDYMKAWTATNLLIRQGRSFSGNEPHCCFLNTRDDRFADVSAISGLNLPEDGRAVALTDWDLDGDLDIWISNRTAPRVRFFKNNLPSPRHFLQIQLNGRTCNRDAVGARVELQLSGGKPSRRIRTVRAGDGFLSQSSKQLHFGLQAVDVIERLIVHWPGGSKDVYRQLQPNRRYHIVQGQPPTLLDRRRAVTLPSHPLKVPASTEAARIRLVAPVPLPRVKLVTDTGQTEPIVTANTRGPALLVLWASWCEPCLVELQELTQAESMLRNKGVRVLALNVDRLQPDADPYKPSQLLETMSFPFESAFATNSLVQALDVVQRTVLDRKRPLPVPSSFLVDEAGQLVAIYRGRADLNQILADVDSINWQPRETRDVAIPFAGRWSSPPEATDPMRIAVALYGAGMSELAIDYTHQIGVFLTEGIGARYMSDTARSRKLTDAYSFRGVILLEQGKMEEAVAALERAIVVQPNDLRSRMKLGEAHARLGNPQKAAIHLSAAALLAPDDPNLHYDLAIALMQSASYLDAITHYRAALKLRPGWPPPANNLAWILATHPDASVRDGRTAVELAREVCRRVNYRDPVALDTLAAALAESGEFDRASDVAVRAIESAKAQKNHELAKSLRERLSGYQAGQPYRDDSMKHP